MNKDINAIGIVRQMVADGQVSQEVAEKYFPELKESEDERIRKDLIVYLRSILSNKKYGDKFIESWITWLEKQGDTFTKSDVDDAYLKGICDAKHELEKQGEHAKFCASIQVGDKVTRNQDGVLVNLSQLKRVAKKDEKHGEQKPDTDFSDLRTWKYIVDAVLTEKEGIGQYLDSPFTEEVAKKLQKRFGKIEQKHEWSKEDKVMLDKVIERLHKYSAGDKEYLDIYYWLIALKGRVQPKQEWLGGDEAHLHSLITHLEQWIERHPNTTGADIQGENITWLKSLRPQSQWKPSEQEKSALRIAIIVMTKERNFPLLGAHLQNILDAFEGKSRADWKPSDEQMKALEMAIDEQKTAEELLKILDENKV